MKKVTFLFLSLLIMSCSNSSKNNNEHNTNYHDNPNVNIYPEKDTPYVSFSLPNKNLVLSKESFIGYKINKATANKELCLKVGKYTYCEKDIIPNELSEFLKIVNNKNDNNKNDNNKNNSIDNNAYIVINSVYLKNNIDKSISIIFDNNPIFDITSDKINFHNLRYIDKEIDFPSGTSVVDVVIKAEKNIKAYGITPNPQNELFLDEVTIANDVLKIPTISPIDSFIIDDSSYDYTKNHVNENYSIKIRKNENAKGCVLMTLELKSGDIIEFNIKNSLKEIATVRNIENIHKSSKSLYVKELQIDTDIVKDIKCYEGIEESNLEYYDTKSCKDDLHIENDNNIFYIGSPYLNISHKYKLSIIGKDNSEIKVLEVQFKSDEFNLIEQNEVIKLVEENNSNSIKDFSVIKMNSDSEKSFMFDYDPTFDDFLKFSSKNQVGSGAFNFKGINISKIKNKIGNIKVDSKDKFIIHLSNCNNLNINLQDCRIKVSSRQTKKISKLDGIEFSISSFQDPYFDVEKETHSITTDSAMYDYDQSVRAYGGTGGSHIYVKSFILPKGEGYTINCANKITNLSYSNLECLNNLYSLDLGNGKYLLGIKVNSSELDFEILNKKSFNVSLNRFEEEVDNFDIDFNGVTEESLIDDFGFELVGVSIGNNPEVTASPIKINLNQDNSFVAKRIYTYVSDMRVFKVDAKKEMKIHDETGNIYNLNVRLKSKNVNVNDVLFSTDCNNSFEECNFKINPSKNIDSQNLILEIFNSNNTIKKEYDVKMN